ncbi:MAG: MBL fold metallo-hydrolase [Verrucomicrobia bacterium]|nr:MAG: MBL fold metallo-hydrolase [Verrucomicrobiota bacterium]
MEVLFMGTGTSQGVPMIACDCSVCRSDDPRNKRTRTSVHVTMSGLHIQVDAAPEFREQCIRHGVVQVDVFLLTHAHADHVLGMDDLRRFCDRPDFPGLPVYSSAEALQRVREIYPYAIGGRPAHRGYPAFVLHEFPETLDLGVGTVSRTVLPHGPMQVLGLVFEERGSGRRFAYYTDCKAVPGPARELARGVDLFVVDGLRPEPHPTHLSIGEAVEVAGAIGAKRTFLTHLTHAVDHETVEAQLPAGVGLARDGLRIEV